MMLGGNPAIDKHPIQGLSEAFENADDITLYAHVQMTIVVFSFITFSKVEVLKRKTLRKRERRGGAFSRLSENA